MYILYRSSVKAYKLSGTEGGNDVEKYVLILILVICAVIFAISMWKKKMELFINFILRLFAGAVGIYLINALLNVANIQSSVGLNGVNVLVVGALGLPGFALLYSVGIYFMLRG